MGRKEYKEKWGHRGPFKVEEGGDESSFGEKVNSGVPPKVPKGGKRGGSVRASLGSDDECKGGKTGKPTLWKRRKKAVCKRRQKDIGGPRNKGVVGPFAPVGG